MLYFKDHQIDTPCRQNGKAIYATHRSTSSLTGQSTLNNISGRSSSAKDRHVCSLLLILAVYAYVPQMITLKASSSTAGISAYYVLFNMLFNDANLSTMLLCATYAWPNGSQPVLEQVNDGNLKEREAFGAILGVLQLLAQWLCAMIV